MRFLWIFLLLLLCPIVYAEQNASESFITDYEYGEMLYNNPRGVSCAECHGKLGEGKVIVSYEGIEGNETISGADIRKKTLQNMIKSVGAYHKIMPHYYLTDDEVSAIYKFIQKKNAVYLQSAK